MSSFLMQAINKTTCFNEAGEQRIYVVSSYLDEKILFLSWSEGGKHFSGA